MFKWVAKLKKDAIWESAKRQLQSGSLSVQEFADANADYPLYYATPFGEDAKGRMRLWVLSDRTGETKYLPVFTASDACKKHFREEGRRAVTIIEGSLEGALHSLDSLKEVGAFGVVIDPQTETPIVIAPGIRISGDDSENI